MSIAIVAFFIGYVFGGIFGFIVAGLIFARGHSDDS